MNRKALPAPPRHAAARPRPRISDRLAKAIDDAAEAFLQSRAKAQAKADGTPNCIQIAFVTRSRNEPNPMASVHFVHLFPIPALFPQLGRDAPPDPNPGHGKEAGPMLPPVPAASRRQEQDASSCELRESHGAAGQGNVSLRI